MGRNAGGYNADKLTCIGTDKGCIAYCVIIAVLVIIGIIPVDLLAAQRVVIYKAKSAKNHITDHFKENIIAKWQRRWNDE